MFYCFSLLYKPRCQHRPLVRCWKVTTFGEFAQKGRLFTCPHLAKLLCYWIHLFQLLPLPPHPTFQALTEDLFCIRHCDRHNEIQSRPSRGFNVGRRAYHAIENLQNMVISTVEIGKTTTNSRTPEEGLHISQLF